MKEVRSKDHRMIEEVFETILFESRFIVLIAVLGILVASGVMFIKGTLEVIQGIRAFFPALLQFIPNNQDDTGALLSFIPAIDNYLFAIILLMISMGLYELFISKIDPKCRHDQTKPDWLLIKDLDDLKSKIGEVVIMILIVSFFKLSFTISYTQPLDLMILGFGVLLISGSLVLAHYASGMIKRRNKNNSSNGI